MPEAIETYRRGVVTTVCTDRDGADGKGLDAPINTVIACSGKSTAYVQAVMSVSAATVAVVVVIYDINSSTVGIGLAPPGEQTATATLYREAASSGDYSTNVLSFDLAGAVSYEVRSADASSGTRTIKTWAI